MDETAESIDQLETRFGDSTNTTDPLLNRQPGISSATLIIPFETEDPHQDDKQKKQPWHMCFQLFTHWGLEISALIISLLGFGLMTYVVVDSHGKPISKWTNSLLTFNAAVSILAGTSKACLAFVISMCLSQGKWNWASRSAQPLIDFDRLDAASRGAWGSLRFLQSCMRRPHWIALGSLTAIALLAFEPVTQAVVTLENQAVILQPEEYARLAQLSNESYSLVPEIGRSTRLDAASWIRRWIQTQNTEFPGPNNETLTYNAYLWPEDNYEDMGLKAAVWNGFSTLVTPQNLRPSFSCATGNCSWTNFASIAICSKCYDISHQMRKTSRSIKLPSAMTDTNWLTDQSLPDVSNPGPGALQSLLGQNITLTKYEVSGSDLSLSNYNGMARCLPEEERCPDTYLSVRLRTNPGQTILFDNLSTMVMAIQYLAANESWRENSTVWENTKVTAQECALSFCVNEYQGFLSQGALNEHVVSSWMTRSPESYSPDDNYGQDNFTIFLKYINQSLDIGSGLRDLSDLQMRIPDEYYGPQISSLSEQTFNVTHSTIVSLLNILNDGFGGYKSPFDDTSEIYSYLVQTTKSLIYPGLGFRKPPGLMEGLGKSKHIPQTIQNVALSLTKWMRDREFETNPVKGLATRTVVVARVRWYLLLFPATCLLGGMTFALLCMWDTQHSGRPALKDSILATLACAPDGDIRLQLRRAAATGNLQALGRELQAVWEEDREIGQLVPEKSEHFGL